MQYTVAPNSPARALMRATRAPQWVSARSPLRDLQVLRARDRFDPGTPNFDVDALIGRVSKNTPDWDAFVQLTHYIRGQGLNRLDWIGRDVGLMTIVRTIVTTPMAVYGTPRATAMEEVRLRVACMAAKAYYEGSNGFVDATVAQGMYNSLRSWAHIARGRFAGSGTLAFKMLELRNIVSRLDTTQTTWQRLRHKLFDVFLLTAILASTFVPILAPTTRALTFLPVLGASTAGNIVGLALLRDMFARKPRAKRWYLRFKEMEDEVTALQRGPSTPMQQVAVVKRLREVIWAPPKSVHLHARSHAYQLGCMDLLDRVVQLSDDPTVLHEAVKTTLTYMNYARTKHPGGLLRQMGLVVALDIEEKLPNDEALRMLLQKWRGTANYASAMQLRAARRELWDAGIPHNLDTLPSAQPSYLEHRLPRLT